MQINDAVLQSGERIIFRLRELYFSKGYIPYRMGKFEEYDFYAGNKEFLVSDNVITFTDIGGKLMALKPDVTLSIIKNSIDEPEKTRKVFYNENVYRVSKGTGSFREIMQAGIECFGLVGADEIAEVLLLAMESLATLSSDAVLAISDLEILSRLIARLQLSRDEQKQLYAAIGEKNTSFIISLCSACTDRVAVDTLLSLLQLHGTAVEIFPQLEALLSAAGEQLDSRFQCIISRISENNLSSMLHLDFSVVDDINYYNGIVFKGFLRGIPTAVLSGGQYDRLMRKLGRHSCAIGFAVYTDAIDQHEQADTSAPVDGCINIALPKGRLGERVYDMFARAGFECPSILEPNRKLVFENPEKCVRYFWVKPSDVSVYVERGAADIGVAGKDILLEYSPDVYELLDLGVGACRMAVAGPKNFNDDTSRTLRVATKFSNITKSFYLAKGRDIDIIHLNGSIEIAPILGLSDVIVDIVETGATLRENNLEVVETVTPITARLIANKASYKFKSRIIETIAAALAAITEE